MRRFVLSTEKTFQDYVQKYSNQEWVCDHLSKKTITKISSDISTISYLSDSTTHLKNINVVACIIFEIFRRHIPFPETTHAVEMYIELVVGLSSIIWTMFVKNLEVIEKLEELSKNHKLLYEHPRTHTEELDRSVISTLRTKLVSESVQNEVSKSLSVTDILNNSVVFSNLDGEKIVEVEKEISVITCGKVMADFLQRMEAILTILEILHRERDIQKALFMTDCMEKIKTLICEYVSKGKSYKGIPDDEKMKRTEIENLCKSNFTLNQLMQCDKNTLCLLIGAIFDSSGRKCRDILSNTKFKKLALLDLLSDLHERLVVHLIPGKTRQPKKTAETKKTSKLRIENERIESVVCYLSVFLCASQQRTYFPISIKFDVNAPPIGNNVPWIYGNSILNMIAVSRASLCRKKMMESAPNLVYFFPLQVKDGKAIFGPKSQQMTSPITLRTLFGALAYNVKRDSFNPVDEINEDTTYEKQYQAADENLQKELLRIQGERTQRYAGAIIEGCGNHVYHMFMAIRDGAGGPGGYIFGCFDALGDENGSERKNGASIYVGYNIMEFYNTLKTLLKEYKSNTLKVSFMRHNDGIDAFSERSSFGVFLQTSNEDVINAIQMMDGHNV